MVHIMGTTTNRLCQVHRIHFVTIEFIHLLDEADYSASQCFDDNVDYDNPDTSGMVQL